MTEFKTQEFPKENRHCLQFETDNRDYFLRVQTAAEECIDHKSLTNYERIKAMTVEEMAAAIYNGISSDPCDYCEHNAMYCAAQCKDMSHTEIIAKWLESEVEE